jgi:hypothetical protein
VVRHHGGGSEPETGECVLVVTTVVVDLKLSLLVANGCELEGGLLVFLNPVNDARTMA